MSITRTNGVIRDTIKFVKTVDIDKNWISASSTFNFCNKDPIVDYIQEYMIPKSRYRGPAEKGTINKDTEFLLKKGHSFEFEIIFKLQQKIKLISIGSSFSKNNYIKTVEAMYNSIPLIHSASLIDEKNSTYGIADLLVRSDFIDKICEKKYNLPKKSKYSLLPNGYYYIVVDIKFTTLNLCSDSIHLLNNHFFPSYKAQLLIYNEALSLIQGYNPNTAFILGRRSTYSVSENGIKNVYISNNPFKRLGKIDYENKDHQMIDTTRDALYWLRDMRRNGENWKFFDPDNENMYPNMKKKSHIKFVESKKEELANTINEITKIWGCGHSKRELAHSYGITSFTNTKLDADLLQFKNKNKEIVDQMLSINRTICEDYILPKKLMNISLERFEKEFFVDIETVSDIFDDGFYSTQDNILIFLIGVGFMKDNKFEYKHFLINKKCKEEELRIMKEFQNYMDTFEGNKILYHWTSVEKRLLGDIKDCSYVDACSLLKREPISIKNCFSYKLKEVHKSLTSESSSTKITSGTDALLEASLKFNKSDNNFTDIIEYNKKDCVMILDILEKLREHYKIN